MKNPSSNTNSEQIGYVYPSEKSQLKEVIFKKVDHTIEKKEVNIGYLSKSQLKKKIDSLPKTSQVKRNRNRKEGINKANDYKHIPDAPRKRCFRCEN